MLYADHVSEPYRTVISLSLYFSLFCDIGRVFYLFNLSTLSSVVQTCNFSVCSAPNGLAGLNLEIIKTIALQTPLY